MKMNQDMMAQVTYTPSRPAEAYSRFVSASARASALPASDATPSPSFAPFPAGRFGSPIMAACRRRSKKPMTKMSCSKSVGAPPDTTQSTSSDTGLRGSARRQPLCASLPSRKSQRPAGASTQLQGMSTSFAFSKALTRKRSTGSATATLMRATNSWSVMYALSGNAWHTYESRYMCCVGGSFGPSAYQKGPSTLANCFW